MSTNGIEAIQLAQMFIQGGANLTKHAKIVDSLNVFPVPDGDTGTNMNLTITSGVKEVRQASQQSIAVVAQAFSKGLLMGARGNSGVILSQLFRGFAKGVEGKTTMGGKDLAVALELGVTTAYKAVMKPVEGTILTVAKDSAKAAEKAAKKSEDPISVMEYVLTEAKASLKRTPDLLPVLKEVGVVDSGGQGLVYIYEGFLAVLKGETISGQEVETPSMEDLVKVEHHNAQSMLATEDIEFGYCTEVMVKFDEEKLRLTPFSENDFRQELNSFGDSLLVVSDDDLLKVHIHAESPGEILNRAQRFGNLINIKIENMREQHTHLLDETKAVYGDEAVSQIPTEKNEYGVVTVSMGDGIEDLFKGLGASVVIPGGQTMNPSTEDIVSAIHKANAHKVIVLPNNGNIIMAAEQAAEVADAEVIVIPSKSVPEGLAALLAFNPLTSLDNNGTTMTDAMAGVKTGQVTYAVRDTNMDGIEIKKDDYMGISEKEIVSAGSSLVDVTKQLLQVMLDEDSEILTVIWGVGATEDTVADITSFVNEKFEDVDVEIHEGKQPLYSFILAVE
ncbi:DAK2 domain-containing protein [Alkalihalobacterium alkalinitrilicum]|uniref:DAK2 domain-containing protein n=1 Tax=Alkalihalobacterium alkalinitrilicum TaxID=427920 RepID=UPI001EE4DD19|nr:DAK2 domain-containing protein [Alkalihalobacterium alkalinitrilicum]